MTTGTRIAALLVAVAVGSYAHAHKPSDSYLRVDETTARFAAEWDIALRDLELLVGLDADQDGQITWGELKAQREAVAAHALSRLSIETNGEPLELRVDDLKVTHHSDGAYAVLLLESDEFDGPKALDLRYRLLFDVDPTHRGLVLRRDSESQQTHVLSRGDARVALSEPPPSLWVSLIDYVGEGVWHIWIGYDHILFLISLLLPAVLVREEDRWAPAESFRPTFHQVLKIVTVFTLAHSVTLWLAVMEYVALPSRLVESVIALSIVLTALNNLRPVLPISGAGFAFGFGLVHGFGFANVLTDLGLSEGSLAVALFGFNVGVELGQLAIVVAFLPIAYALRKSAFYKWGVLIAGSLLIALLAAIWFYERAFNASIITA